MTLSTTAPTQSPVHNQNAPFPPPPLTTPSPPSERGYSDSIVPSCRMSAEKQSQLSGDASPPVFDPALESSQDCAASKHWTLPSRKKAKQVLKLPSFQALGMATPPIHPTALLTPPDEGLISGGHPLHSTIISHPERQPFRSDSMPTSSQEGFDTTPKLTQMTGSTSFQPQLVTVTTPHGHISTPEDQSSTPTEKTQTARSPTTIFSDPIDLVTSAATSNSSRTVFNVLCHSQPCPLPNEDTPTTAFSELLTKLQRGIPFGAYIEITHAIPLRFNMGQVPHSPVVTPSPLQEIEPTDYFSIQNTFSKAVIATSYQDALESSVPSSPHPVVAPATVHISLLERYIPPTQSYEFKDLFSTDAPSALVNRLTELSPDKGCLIFTYPTKAGAHTFNSDYLGPILHPLLRRMAGIYTLATDLGTNIARVESMEHLIPFEDMKRKLNLLLRKLGRRSMSTSASSSYRPKPPHFEVIHSSARTVQLARTSWQNWYLHQEKSRIQETVGRYFRRGYKLPNEPGMTAGTICREIMQGLEHQEYACDSPPREGVEVGVFVVQRLG